MWVPALQLSPVPHLQVEAQMPAWISRFLAQPRQDAGTAGLLLQREDLQAELRALELRILAQMREERGLAARDSIGVALRQGGAGGVTEEVSGGRALGTWGGIPWSLQTTRATLFALSPAALLSHLGQNVTAGMTAEEKMSLFALEIFVGSSLRREGGDPLTLYGLCARGDIGTLSL